MTRVLNHRRQIVLIITLAYLALFTVAPSVLADDDVLQGSSIATGETVENDVLLGGSDVSLNGNVVGDALIVGRTIVINGDIAGSLIVVGENVIMNGQVEGSIYSLAVSFSHLSDAVIERSLYYLGISLVTEQDSEIGRDLTAVTLGARQTGSVGRNTQVVSGIIEIARLVLDRVNAVTTGKPLIEPVAALERPMLDTQLVELERLAGSVGPVGRPQRTITAQDEPTAEDDANAVEAQAFGDWLIGRLRELVSYLLVGGLLIWLFPTYLDNWASQVRQKPLAAGGWGLVAYIMGFVAHIIFFLLILAVGISFAFVTLWSLAWAWLGVGVSALALTFSLFLVTIALISKIIVAYLFGRLLFERFSSRPDMRKPWPLLVGLLIYVLLCGIPYLGWAVSLVVTFLGLGGIWLAYAERSNRQKAMASAQSNN